MEYLTVTQLAEKLGYSRWWIHTLLTKGVIKSEKIGDLRVVHKSEANKYSGNKYHVFPRKRRVVRKKTKKL